VNLFFKIKNHVLHLFHFSPIFFPIFPISLLYFSLFIYLSQYFSFFIFLSIPSFPLTFHAHFLCRRGMHGDDPNLHRVCAWNTYIRQDTSSTCCDVVSYVLKYVFHSKRIVIFIDFVSFF